MLLNPERKISSLDQLIINRLTSVYDPEIPLNIYDLGIVYDLVYPEEGTVEIIMTLTSPNCPMVDELMWDIKEKVLLVDEIKDVKVKIIFEPPWDDTMLSEEAKLVLGLL